MQLPYRNGTQPSANQYEFNGMRKDEELKGAGNSYDFGARMYDPRVGRWLSVDPLAGKYSAFSPYNCVLNSPLMFIDPTGEEVKPIGEALELIKNTLPPDAREFVVVDPTTGLIDRGKLRECQGSSDNFKCLLVVAESDEIHSVALETRQYELPPYTMTFDDGDVYTERWYDDYGTIRPLTEIEKERGFNGEVACNLSTNEGSDNGIGASYSSDQTLSGHTEIVVKGNLSPQGQIETLAHKLYGHAYLCIADPEKSSHDRPIDSVGGDRNLVLKEQTVKATKEAVQNFLAKPQNTEEK